MSTEVMVSVLQMVEDNPSFTLSKIVEKLSEQGIQTSISSLNRFLENTEITWKDTLSIPKNWNSEQVLEERIRYVKEFLYLKHNREVVFIGETGLHLSEMQRSIDSPPSETYARLEVLPKSKRLNIIIAMSRSEIVLTRQKMCTLKKKNKAEGKGEVNSEDLLSFLLDLAPKIPRGSLLVMNHSVHRLLNETNWHCLEETYGFKLLCIPPYSPFLNPVELYLSNVKMKLKEENFTISSEFQNKVVETLNNFNSQNVKGIICKCSDYFGHCLMGLPFSGNILSPELGS